MNGDGCEWQQYGLAVPWREINETNSYLKPRWFFIIALTRDALGGSPAAQIYISYCCSLTLSIHTPKCFGTVV